MTVAMISGHLDLTETEFKQHYHELIEYAIALGHSFVVGDARGADSMAQAYLSKRNVPTSHVKVYHAFKAPRNHHGFETNGGYKSQSAKDKAMTLASDYDIAWVREGRESSGTARNIERRKKLSR